MYRFLFIVVAVVVVALAVGYGLRSSHKTSALVTSLLPRETVALLHVPDLERTRDDWHRSDIYQLYTEPAVQEFLRRPLGRLPKEASVSNAAHDLEQLDPKDAFLAVTSAGNPDPGIVAGFRFRGTPEDADRRLEAWRQKILGSRVAATPPATVAHGNHPIHIYQATTAVSVATAYTDHWFFASNKIEELEAVLDRADGHVSDTKTLLSSDPNFREAMANMPASYAVCFYLQPKALAQKLVALRASAGQTTAPNQLTMIEQMRSVCASTRFDGGKMHDVFFVGMPEQTAEVELTRNSIALASSDTFIYLASLLNISKQFALVDPSPSSSFLGARLQKIGQGLAAAGITADQWNTVFGSEIGAIADWRAESHWPATLLTFPVKDFARAKKIAPVLARTIDDDGAWVETDKNGAHYIAMPYTAGLVTFRPTIGISDRFMVVGLDTLSVESAIERASAGSINLSSSTVYKRAAQSLPEPTHMFTYLDLGLLYTRLDATLRPMLLMGAAFMPAINDYVEVGKLPPAEVIAKHLSPTVSSQRYRNNGYIAESIGPITVSQAGLGTLMLVAAGAAGYQHSGLSGMAGGLALPQVPLPTPSPSSGWSGKGVKLPSPSPTVAP